MNFLITVLGVIIIAYIVVSSYLFSRFLTYRKATNELVELCGKWNDLYSKLFDDMKDQAIKYAEKVNELGKAKAEITRLEHQLKVLKLGEVVESKEE